MRASTRRIPRTQADYASALATAVARSPLSRFPEVGREELLSRGTRLDARARSLFFREGDPAISAIVVHGVIRIFASAEDGREFTLLWAHAGEWLGHGLIAGGPSDVSAQAVTDASLHVIPVERLESLARADPIVAWEFARQIAGRLRQASALIRMLAFMDLRERIGQRLVELAFRRPPGAPLVAMVTQQELADAVGSPRTSVARILADLRREGIVRSVSGGIQVVQAERLAPSLRSSLDAA